MKFRKYLLPPLPVSESVTSICTSASCGSRTKETNGSSSRTKSKSQSSQSIKKFTIFVSGADSWQKTGFRNENINKRASDKCCVLSLIMIAGFEAVLSFFEIKTKSKTIYVFLTSFLFAVKDLSAQCF
jgi:hypothetical protein